MIRNQRWRKFLRCHLVGILSMIKSNLTQTLKSYQKQSTNHPPVQTADAPPHRSRYVSIDVSNGFSITILRLKHLYHIQRPSFITFFTFRCRSKKVCGRWKRQVITVVHFSALSYNPSIQACRINLLTQVKPQLQLTIDVTFLNIWKHRYR